MVFFTNKWATFNSKILHPSHKNMMGCPLVGNRFQFDICHIHTGAFFHMEDTISDNIDIIFNGRPFI